jgi:hypothetical protein
MQLVDALHRLNEAGIIAALSLMEDLQRGGLQGKGGSLQVSAQLLVGLGEGHD